MLISFWYQVGNQNGEGQLATKEAQINLRLPVDLDEWVETQAGGKREKPAFIRQVLERERAREGEEQLLAMFNAAWDSLSETEKAEMREEREDWMGAYEGGRRA
jgi:hypothetical protein